VIEPMSRGVLDTPPSRSMTVVGEAADADHIRYFPANFFIAGLIGAAASS
jgi:hypothetical protein